jgi:hypothetical protein
MSTARYNAGVTAGYSSGYSDGVTAGQASITGIPASMEFSLTLVNDDSDKNSSVTIPNIGYKALYVSAYGTYSSHLYIDDTEHFATSRTSGSVTLDISDKRSVKIASIGGTSGNAPSACYITTKFYN